ncbi:MAG: YesL family protein [Lachnospiraceae bacterium]|nr:YesL family protein [Lachnospiraceae bacterium]
MFKNGFNIESALWRVLGFVGDLAILNLLFILTSLPVFTIGASVTALSSVQFRMIEKRSGRVAGDYFRAFRENFKASTVLWLVYLVFLAICVLNFLAVYNTNPENRNVIMVVLGIALFFVTMVEMYSLAMQARFVNSLKDTVVKAFLVGLSGLPYTIVMVLVIIAAVGVSVRTYTAMLFAFPIWLVLGFSLIGYLCNLMYLRVFHKVTAKQDLPEKTIFDAPERENYRSGDRRRSLKRREKEAKMAERKKK